MTHTISGPLSNLQYAMRPFLDYVLQQQDQRYRCFTTTQEQERQQWDRWLDQLDISHCLILAFEYGFSAFCLSRCMNSTMIQFPPRASAYVNALNSVIGQQLRRQKLCICGNTVKATLDGFSCNEFSCVRGTSYYRNHEHGFYIISPSLFIENANRPKMPKKGAYDIDATTRIQLSVHPRPLAEKWIACIKETKDDLFRHSCNYSDIRKRVVDGFKQSCPLPEQIIYLILEMSGLPSPPRERENR